MDRKTSFTLLKECVFGSLQDKKARVFLFGSCARGRERKSSDIDIGIMPGKARAGENLYLLREKIEELPIPYKVDIVDLGEAGKAFRESVMKEGILWKR